MPLRTLTHAIALGILLGLALFAAEFLISVRLLFTGIVSWGQALAMFAHVGLLYSIAGGLVGGLAALITRRTQPALSVFVGFQLYALALLAVGHGHFALPTWCYAAIIVQTSILALMLYVLGRWFARRAPRLSASLFWLASFGTTGALAVIASSTASITALSQSGAPDGRQVATDRPNIVLIVLDTVRADHLSVYGYARDTTPNLAALATDAIVFERALAPAPWTVPSHASLFTGKLPGMHGAHQEHMQLSESEDTLAELLAAGGYHTAAIVNNPFLSPRLGFAQGFNDFNENWAHMLRRHGFMLVTALGRLRPGAADQGARSTVDAARTFIGRNRERPFFLFLNFMEAHAPYGTIPESLRGRFRSGPPPARFGYWMDAALPDVVTGKRELTVDEQQTIVDLYDASIFYLDRMIGEIVDALADSDVLDRTVLVITSDHGEHLGDFGLVSHFFSLYDAVLHVPLIVRAPGILQGERVAEAVRLQDLFATLLGAAQIPAPPRVFSASLLDRPLGDRLAVAEAYRPWFMMRRLGIVIDHAALQELDVRRRSIERERLKLIRVDRQPPMLFDIDRDAAERMNLAPARPRDLATLSAALDQIIAGFPDREAHFPGFDPISLQRLRALGYVR